MSAFFGFLITLLLIVFGIAGLFLIICAIAFILVAVGLCLFTIYRWLLNFLIATYTQSIFYCEELNKLFKIIAIITPSMDENDPDAPLHSIEDNRKDITNRIIFGVLMLVDLFVILFFTLCIWKILAPCIVWSTNKIFIPGIVRLWTFAFS